jgi:hypothetical protein
MFRISLTRFLAWSAIAVSLSLHAQTKGGPERYTALAINMERGTSGSIEIVVDRWSTDQDRDKLMSVMKKEGPDKLLDTLQRLPRVGYLRTPDSLGWDIRFAHKVPGEDGGDRVVLLTDRRIGFWEAVNRPRSIDYPFTVIELRLNRDREGEGKMSLATNQDHCGRAKRYRDAGELRHPTCDVEERQGHAEALNLIVHHSNIA